jgi:DNA helicase-2/ATP-dependent DNA helicase PcrA
LVRSGTAAAASIAFEKELNPQQLEAVTSQGGAALVIAGAGSGKTRTLTYRVAFLLSQGVPAGRILLLTFTNKAAREMLDRVATLVPGASEGLWGGTFHSVGNRILRRHAERIGFRRGFTIMDRDDSEDLIEAAVAGAGLNTPDRRFPKGGVLADIFSLSVNTGASIRELLNRRYSYFVPLAAQIEHAQACYETRKQQANAMDFDDLLSKTFNLLTTCPDVEEQCQFEHVLVDEYQDTNRLQTELAERFARRSGNIMVVGDDAQSIYSWRGADFENILRFPQRRADARVFKIETNYRSVPAVLDVANAAIRANTRQFGKNLAPARPPSESRPAIVALATNSDQAAFVAQRVLELHHEEGIALEEIAVLYRAHFHSLEVQLEFTKRDIPFAITSGLRFFEQAHVKDTAAFLKLALNPRDELSFKRAARLLPGIGAKSAETLWQQASAVLGGEPRFPALQGLKAPTKAAKGWMQFVHTLCDLRPEGATPGPAAMIETVLFAMYDDYMKQKFANYEARREDLATLAAFAGQFESCEDFLAQLSLLGAVESADAVGSGERDRVMLSTIHQAKGLEWSVVFLVWLAEGMFPNARSSESEAGLEEERRLFYVGITRCRDELYLSYPELRLGAGYGDAFQRPSRFLEEIPESLLETWNVRGSAPPPDDTPF